MNGLWSVGMGFAAGMVSAAVKLPTAAVVVVAVLGAAELVLFIWALVDLIRRPHTTLLPRWAWLVLMIIFELFGPILYLALGRGQATAAGQEPAAGGIGGADLEESHTQRAVDLLYGPGKAAEPHLAAQAPSGDPDSKPSQWAAPANGEAPAVRSAPPVGGEPQSGPGGNGRDADDSGGGSGGA